MTEPTAITIIRIDPTDKKEIDDLCLEALRNPEVSRDMKEAMYHLRLSLFDEPITYKPIDAVPVLGWFKWFERNWYTEKSGLSALGFMGMTVYHMASGIALGSYLLGGFSKLF